MSNGPIIKIGGLFLPAAAFPTGKTTIIQPAQQMDGSGSAPGSAERQNTGQDTRINENKTPAPNQQNKVNTQVVDHGQDTVQHQVIQSATKEVHDETPGSPFTTQYIAERVGGNVSQQANVRGHVKNGPVTHIQNNRMSSNLNPEAMDFNFEDHNLDFLFSQNETERAPGAESTSASTSTSQQHHTSQDHGYIAQHPSTQGLNAPRLYEQAHHTNIANAAIPTQQWTVQSNAQGNHFNQQSHQHQTYSMAPTGVSHFMQHPNLMNITSIQPSQVQSLSNNMQQPMQHQGYHDFFQSEQGFPGMMSQSDFQQQCLVQNNGGGAYQHSTTRQAPMSQDYLPHLQPARGSFYTSAQFQPGQQGYMTGAHPQQPAQQTNHPVVNQQGRQSMLGQAKTRQLGRIQSAHITPTPQRACLPNAGMTTDERIRYGASQPQLSKSGSGSSMTPQPSSSMNQRQQQRETTNLQAVPRPQTPREILEGDPNAQQPPQILSVAGRQATKLSIDRIQREQVNKLTKREAMRKAEEDGKVALAALEPIPPLHAMVPMTQEDLMHYFSANPKAVKVPGHKLKKMSMSDMVKLAQDSQGPSMNDTSAMTSPAA